MKRILKDAAQKNHRNYSCLIVSVVSHGDKGTLYGVDSEEGSKAENNALLVEDLTTYFDGMSAWT